MTSTSPVVLILGAGPNVGEEVAKAFAAKGYIVAVTSRSAKEEDSTADRISLRGDLSDPNSVVEIFSKLKARHGLPSVVVYNAAAVTPVDGANPLSYPLDNFTRELNVNTTSAFVAAQQAALAFDQLPASASKTFIYTGNMLNITFMPALIGLGIGKSATAHIIQTAAHAYADRGYKFYYADERKSDGSPALFDINGKAHGELYVRLAEGKSQGPWQYTFVNGDGYKDFAAK